MRSNTKQALLVTLVGVTLFVALLRLSDVLAFAAQLVDLVLPILAGGILALFLSVPMAGLEKRLGRLFAKARKQPSGKALHLLSFLLTLLGVVLVLVLALTLLIPELVQSFHSLYLQIEANIPRWTAYLHAQDPDMGWLMSRLEGIDWEQLLHKVTSGLDTVLVNAAGAVSATVNLVVTASFALIISVYLSLGAQSLGHQARTLVRAYLKPGHAAWVLKFCRLFRQSFANFLTGQCSEAVILGMLMSLAFSLFRIPYGSLVGMLTAICAIIPYVGGAALLRHQRAAGAAGGPPAGGARFAGLPCGAVHREPVHLPPGGGQIGGAFAPVHPCGSHDRRQALRHPRHPLLHPADGGGAGAGEGRRLPPPAHQGDAAINKQRPRRPFSKSAGPCAVGLFYLHGHGSVTAR